MEFAFSETVVLKDELSGAAQELTPIQRQHCFASMDVLRGIALLRMASPGGLYISCLGSPATDGFTSG
jgi:hypothetical protein